MTDPDTPSASLSGAAMDRRIVRRGPPRRRLIWISAALAAVVATAAVVVLLPAPGSLMVKASDLEISPVHQAPFQDYLPVRGEVAPLKTVFVDAVSGGQVDQVLATDGADVAAGAALATLSNPQLKLDVISKEAAIAGQLGDVSAQQLTLERNTLDRQREIAETGYDLLKAKHDLDIRQRLHAQGFVSDAGVKTFADEAAYYDQRLKTLKSGQAAEDQIAKAEADQIKLTGARLNSNLGAVEQSLATLAVRAPVAGRLTDFTLEPGQTLKAGDQVGQIDSEGAYKVTADVDEFYLGRVSTGQSAVADIDGQDVAMTVSRVLPQVTSGRFRVELTFDKGPPAGLRRGESADIRITLGDTRQALVLPNGAWMEAGGGTTAFVVDADGRRADRRAITVGRRNPDQVEITSGLHPGERVVSSSYAGWDKYTHLIIR